MVDARLADGQTDGWRYDDMPEDADAFRASLAGLERDARRARADGFLDLEWAEQAQLIGVVQNGPERLFLRGMDALCIEARGGPVAITNGRFGNRPHCIHRGFCLQGCKVNAKASP